MVHHSIYLSSRGARGGKARLGWDLCIAARRCLLLEEKAASSARRMRWKGRGYPQRPWRCGRYAFCRPVFHVYLSSRGARGGKARLGWDLCIAARRCLLLEEKAASSARRMRWKGRGYPQRPWRCGRYAFCRPVFHVYLSSRGARGGKARLGWDLCIAARRCLLLEGEGGKLCPPDEVERLWLSPALPVVRCMFVPRPRLPCVKGAVSRKAD